jgi:poly(3-hydroxybutyrate) depolymerase
MASCRPVANRPFFASAASPSAQVFLRNCALLLFLTVALNAQVSHHVFPFHQATYRYSVFTPNNPTAAAHLPALLVIHGAGGHGIDMLNLWKDFAESQRIILVAPDFPLDAQFEATELFPALMETVRQARHFDPRRIYIFGYSAGGYCTFDAATLASTYFAAAGVFAAIISPEYDSIVVEAKRKTPIAIYIGTRDPYYTLAQTRRTRDLLQGHDFPVHYLEMANRDHNYGAASSTVNPDVWKFMSQYSLPGP